MSYIDKALKKAGNQRNLAEILGCTQQSVSNFKRAGKVPPVHALKLADYLDMKVEDVLKEGADND